MTGWYALLAGIAAVALPTIVRAAVSGSITGCEFTPYLPFVLLAAILLGWRQAGAVALVSVAILGGLFVGPQAAITQKACFISGAGVFLASSAVIIAVVMSARRAIRTSERRGADERSGGIVFSVERGEVWASWHGQGAPLRLGPQRNVARTMREFLAGARPADGGSLPD